MEKIATLERMEEICCNLKSVISQENRRREEMIKLFDLIGINKKILQSEMINSFLDDMKLDKLEMKTDLILSQLLVAEEYREIGANPGSIFYKGYFYKGLIYTKHAFWAPSFSKDGMEIYDFTYSAYLSRKDFERNFKRNALNILIFG